MSQASNSTSQNREYVCADLYLFIPYSLKCNAILLNLDLSSEIFACIQQRARDMDDLKAYLSKISEDDRELFKELCILFQLEVE